MTQNGQPNNNVPLRQQHISQYFVVQSKPWPVSTVDEDATISKKKGCDKYVLKPKEVQDLSYDVLNWKDRATGEPRTAHLYRERELEQRAREKYHCPESLEKARCQLAQKENQSVGQSSFSQGPSASTTSPSPVSAEPKKDTPGTGSAECDTEMRKIDTLAAMQDFLEGAGKGWLWNMLDITFENTFGSGAAVSVLRSEVILAARGPFVSRYPARQRTDSVEPSLLMRPLSRSFTKLYKIMDDALNPENHKKQVVDKVTLEVISKADWTQKYYNCVYWALITVTKSYGLQGWEEARWVVYDKYTECKFGSVYVEKRKTPTALGAWQWGDSASFWLHRAEYKMGSLMKDGFLKLFVEEKR